MNITLNFKVMEHFKNGGAEDRFCKRSLSVMGQDIEHCKVVKPRGDSRTVQRFGGADDMGKANPARKLNLRHHFMRIAL